MDAVPVYALESGGHEVTIDEDYLDIMADTVGTAVDADCFEHLKKIIAQSPALFPR